MKIAIVYESKREQRRMERLKKKISRLGLGALEVFSYLYCAASCFGILIFSCLIDSKDFNLMFKGLIICLINAAVSAGLISVLKEI